MNNDLKTETTLENYKGILIKRTTHSIPIYVEAFEDIFIFEFNLVQALHYYYKEQLPDKPCSTKRELELEEEFSYYNFDPTDKKDNPFFYALKVYDKNMVEQMPFIGILAGRNSYNESILTNSNKHKLDQIWDKELLDYIYHGKIHHSNPLIRDHIEYDMANLIIEILGIAKDLPWAIENCKTKKEKDEKIALLMNLLLYTYDDFDECEKYDFGFIDQINNIQDSPTKNYYSFVLLSFIEFITDNNILQECHRCEQFFVPRKGKKYCNKSCLISMANRRFYMKKYKNHTEH